MARGSTRRVRRPICPHSDLLRQCRHSLRGAQGSECRRRHRAVRRRRNKRHRCAPFRRRD
eukprot:569593-Pleurochrysis_carterae.AAC.1